MYEEVLMSKGNGSNGHEDLDTEGYRRSLLGKLKEQPDFALDGGGCADREDGHAADGNGHHGEHGTAGTDHRGERGEPCVELVAKVELPTRFGDFTLYGFYDGVDDLEHTALVRGDIAGKDDVPVRVHSECHTGDVFGSLRCDCRDQLEASLAYVAKQDFGAIIYLRQEGRGIGLLNKIKAYRLQELGLDTVEANHFLGYPAEARTYSVAAAIIRLLNIRSLALLSNNPDKLSKLAEDGISITRRIPLVIPANSHNSRYLDTKRDKMGHLY
jgi:GTP cyclohydrolase II